MHLLTTLRGILTLLIIAATKLSAQLYVFEGVITDSTIPGGGLWPVGSPIEYSHRLIPNPDSWMPGLFEYYTNYQHLKVGDTDYYGSSMPFPLSYDRSGYYGAGVGYFGFFWSDSYGIINPLFSFGSYKNKVTTPDGRLIAGLPLSDFEVNEGYLYVENESGPYYTFHITSYSVDGVSSGNAQAVPEPSTLFAGGIALIGASLLLWRRLKIRR
jgi:hypothetical protein